MTDSTRRQLPESREIGLRRWAWAVEIPWLPDLLADGDEATVTGRPVMEAFGKQIALLRALAASEPRTSYQLRFLADDDPDGVVRCIFVGGAPSAAAARRASIIAMNGLPPEFPSVPIPPELLDTVLRPFSADSMTFDSVMEIRRSIEPLDRLSDTLEVADPAVLPWSWTQLTLLSTLDLLRRQPGKCLLAVHVEPAVPSPELIAWLQDDILRFLDAARDADENPLVATAVHSYRRWMRDLPQGALHLRVVLASDQSLLPGTGHLIGADLTRTWEANGGPRAMANHYSLAVPSSPRELDAAIRLLDDLQAQSWQVSVDGPLSELLFMFDPLEANTAFRLPIAPRGGLQGVAVQRVTSLAGGHEMRDIRTPAVVLGKRTGGGTSRLTHAELNQHLLVAGLPGFGKTSTIHSLLFQLSCDDIPFLVIDPAKEDYRQLAHALDECGRECDVIRLTHSVSSLNPLASPPGVDPKAHAGRILAAFDAAFHFTPDNPAGWVWMGRALYAAIDEAHEEGRTPNLSDLHRHITLCLRQAGYSASMLGDLQAMLLGRVEFLADGPAGSSLLAGEPIDWDRLMSQPTIIELGAFSGQQERSLIFALLLAGLASYRETHRESGRLTHVTVLEEAHRVLGARTGSLGADLFVEAIAELRGAGEGFIVAEQAPSLLHPGVSKLTASKIAHRVVETLERDALASSMLLDLRQSEELARLAPGRAIAYTAGSSLPVLVDVERVTHTELPPPTLKATGTLPGVTGEAKGLACAGCPIMCSGRHGLVTQAALSRTARRTRSSAEEVPKLFQAARTATASLPHPVNAAYCVTAHELAARHGDSPRALRTALAQARGLIRIRPIPKPSPALDDNPTFVSGSPE